MSKISKNFNYKSFFNDSKDHKHTQQSRPQPPQTTPTTPTEGIEMKIFPPSQSPSLPLKWQQGVVHDVDSVVQSFKRNVPLILQVASPTCPQCSQLQQHDKLFVVTYGEEKRIKCIDIMNNKEYTVPLVARRLRVQPFVFHDSITEGVEGSPGDFSNKNQHNNVNNNLNDIYAISDNVNNENVNNNNNVNNINLLNTVNNNNNAKNKNNNHNLKNNNNNNDDERATTGMLYAEDMEGEVTKRQKRYLEKLRKMAVPSAYQAPYMVVCRLKKDLLVPPLMVVCQDDNFLFHAASGIHCDSNNKNNNNNNRNNKLHNNTNINENNNNQNNDNDNTYDNDVDDVVTDVDASDTDDVSYSLWKEYYQMHVMSAKSFPTNHLDSSIVGQNKIYVDTVDIESHREHINNHKECLHNTSIRIDNYKINKSASDITNINNQTGAQNGLKKQDKHKSMFKSCQLLNQQSSVLLQTENSLFQSSDVGTVDFNKTATEESGPQKLKKVYPHMGTSVVVSGRRSFDQIHVAQQKPPINHQHSAINLQQPTTSHQQNSTKKYQETLPKNEFLKLSAQNVDNTKQRNESNSWDKSSSSRHRYTKHTHEFVINDKIHTTSNPTIQKKLNPARHTKIPVNRQQVSFDQLSSKSRLSSLFPQNTSSSTNLSSRRKAASNKQSNLYKSLSSTTLHQSTNLHTPLVEITMESRGTSNIVESTTRKTKDNITATKNNTLRSVDEGYFTNRSKEYFI